MSKTYRLPTLQEEEEPLTAGSDVGSDDMADEKLAWRSGKKTMLERLQRLSPHWVWFAHAALLSLSMTFFALSFCIKSAKHNDGGHLPDTYCMFGYAQKNGTIH